MTSVSLFAGIVGATSNLNPTALLIANAFSFVFAGLWFGVVVAKPYLIAMGRDKQKPAPPGALYACQRVKSVTCLGASRSLIDLDLSETGVTSEGIEGLERIPTLTKLNLGACSGIASVSGLAESTSLVELWLDATSVTLEAVWCLGRIPTLAHLHVRQCKWIKRCPSLATLRKKAAAELVPPAQRHRAE